MSLRSRAVVIEGPGKARLVEREVAPPAAGELLVRVAWQGVCATDLEILEGTLGLYTAGLARYPITPGHELSGRVEAAGPGVSGLAPGDPVVVECIQGCGACAACAADDAIGCAARRELGVMNMDGGYAELVRTPARFAHKVPPGLPLRAASLAEPLAVVCKGLRRLEAAWGAAPGPRAVAVVGGGTIGTLAALALRAHGHAPTVIEKSADRRASAARAGLASAAGLEGLAAFDAVVEATGSADALARVLELTRPGAALLLLGLPYGERPFSFERLVLFDKTVVGSVGSAARDFDAALRLLPRLDVSALAPAAFALEDYAKAWDEARAKGCLKAALRVDPSA